jgi:carboxyl-terminal processing protease
MKSKMKKSRRLYRSLYLCTVVPLFSFFLFSFAFTTAGSKTVSTETREGRLAVFDDLWETVNARYYDTSFHGVDWQAQREAFRPLAAEARNTAEFYAILRRMLGSLHDAHTRVFAPDEKFDWRRPRFIGVGLAVREVAGQPVVVQVERGSAAERAGLRAGDAVNSIDGQPALELFARRLEAQQGASTVAATRLRAMAALFEGASNSLVRVGWVDERGRRREATLRREWRERETRLSARRLSGDYRLVQFDAFTQEAAQEFWRVMRGKLGRARGLVLDLRGNGGGDAEVMTEIASAFLPAGRSLGQFIDRDGRVAFAPQTRAVLLLTADPLLRFQGSVVILVSERTSSAAEIFAAALAENGRADLIGKPTCGCALAIRRRHALPDGGELDVSEMDYFTAAGKRLEGEGIIPDIAITLDRQDIRAHRDRAMESAIERLTSKSRN